VERVLARLFALGEPLPAAKPRLRALAARLVPRRRPSDYAQAMMDLGATVCIPRAPLCPACPVRGFCAAAAAGEAGRYPLKPLKPARPQRRGDAFVIVRVCGDGEHILLRRRPGNGLLAGMMEVPCTEWVVNGSAPGSRAALSANWRQGRTVQQAFTHFRLELRVFAARSADVPDEAREFGGEWVQLAGLARFALPSVMRKAAAAGCEVLGIDGCGFRPTRAGTPGTPRRDIQRGSPG